MMAKCQPEHAIISQLFQLPGLTVGSFSRKDILPWAMAGTTSITQIKGSCLEEVANTSHTALRQRQPRLPPASQLVLSQSLKATTQTVRARSMSPPSVRDKTGATGLEQPPNSTLPKISPSRSVGRNNLSISRTLRRSTSSTAHPTQTSRSLASKTGASA
jgi:hypothetical protein